MELTGLTIKKAGELLRQKEATSVELTEACFLRIDSQDQDIRAYLTLLRKQALKQAEAQDRALKNGDEASSLAGIPLAIKDNMLIEGASCTAGSRILENYTAAYDAFVITKLRRAGAVFLGKTNMDEFAMGSSTEHSAFFQTKNPRALDRVPGGSSGGSAAAVAADLAIAALGSDTGGSIRQPASFCGVVGLKPTYGRVSRSGLIAMASSLDQIGPMTKTVEDAALLFSVIAGHDPHDATSHPQADYMFRPELLNLDLEGLRIGMPKEYFVEGIDPLVLAEIERAMVILKDLGAEVREVSLPHAKYGLATYYLIMPAEVSANLARFDGIRYGASMLRHKPYAMGHKHDKEGLQQDLWDVYFKTRRENFGDEVRRRIMLGTYALSAGYYDAYYLKAQRVRAVIKRDFDAALNGVDVLVTPTSPILPFPFGERLDDPLSMYLADIYTVSVNLAGVPAISLPCGWVADGGSQLPVGIQFIAAPFGEDQLFRVAYALEQALQ